MLKLEWAPSSKQLRCCRRVASSVASCPGKKPADIKADFCTAIVLKGGRVVFNIAGNKYRLVTSINYSYGIVFVRFVGTHQQYNAIDAQTI